MKKKERLVGTNKWAVKKNAHQKDGIDKVVGVKQAEMPGIDK